MPQHEGTKHQSDASAMSNHTSTHPSSVHSGDNSKDNSCCAIYTIDNNHLRDMMKTHSSNGAQQADTLNKLLKQFGVELVSIGLPNYDPQSKQIESELTICAKDVDTLGAAMFELGQLGLPFKRNNNCYSGGRLPNFPNVVNNRQASGGRDWTMQEPPPEFTTTIHGLAKRSTSSEMGRSFMSNDNDVFGGNRQRSYSAEASSSREINGSSSGRTRVEPTIQRTTLSQILESDMKSRTPQPGQNDRGSQVTPSKSLRIASHSLSLPLPRLVGRKDDISPTESSGKHSTDSEGWTKIDNPNESSKGWPDLSIITTKKEVYQVPQRRLSDARDLPKLRIDTSSATLDVRKKWDPMKTSAAPVSAPLPETEILTGASDTRSYATAPPVSNPFTQDVSQAKESFTSWGPYIGGSEASGNYNTPNLASTVTGEASQLNAGYQGARSYTYRTGTEPPRMDPQGTSTGASHPTINTGYHSLPVGPVSPVRQQPSYGYPPTRPEQSSQAYRFNQAAMEHNVRVQVPSRTMQENVRPRTQQQQGQNYGGYGGGYTGVPRSGYPTGPAFHAPTMPFRQEFYQHHPPPEIYMGTSSGDGFASYTLKPIPPTGPRFIR
ncbi:hypothetical protein BDD12DRAFT_874200 [Trichophaea hybrida]|nr:hypothetical protein BDD12DRAFT_874200 [Trichophaea hybrida]